MNLLIGLIMVFTLVFGGFVLSGGSMDIVLHALPYEGMIIGGASVGALIIGNSWSILRGVLRGIGKVVKGPRFKAADYEALLKLMYELSRLYRAKGIIALDPHVENPQESEIFKRYPEVMKDKFAVDLITESFRMLAMSFESPHETEDLINRKIKKHHKAQLKPADAIHKVADALPAIGIVAAVLGIIKTMGSIDKPPAILGGMIGGALVGTFLGVFLAYCIVAPIHGRLEQIENEEVSFYHVIRDMFVALVASHPPNICVEIGRSAVSTEKRPEFQEMEEIIRNISKAA
jgi:chemotaxis protein MotA